jgi:hypothetical protein
LTLRQDVVQVILSRGELRRDESKSLWQLTDEQYDVLRHDLQQEKLLEPMRGVGGFQAEVSRCARPWARR